MKQVIFLLVIVLHFLSFSCANSENITIGVSVWSGYPENLKGFKAALNKAGFVQGKNVTYLYRNAHANTKKQQDIATEFLQKKVDLVYSLTTPGTTIIKNTIPREIPVIFSIVTYPDDSGLIESFDYSGNNLVGTSNFVPLNNYVTLLKKMLPKVKSVAIFRRKGEPNSKIQTVNLTRLLKRAGVKVIDQAPDSIDSLIDMSKEVVKQVDAIITTTDTLMQSGGEKALIEISLKNKIPILSSNKQGVIDGATFGPVADLYTLGKMSGEMAVRVLRDKNVPSSLQSKVQSPPLILINNKSMNSLGLVIPDGLGEFKYVE